MLESKDFNTSFEHDTNLKDSAIKSKQRITDVSLRMNEVNGEIKRFSKYKKIVVEVVRSLTSFGFCVVFISSYKYYRNYLQDMRFDNLIVTQYFRHIDARRFVAGKRTLLPLRKYETESLFYPLQYYIAAYQSFAVKKNILLFKSLLVFIAISIFVDEMLVEFMQVWKENSQVNMHHNSYSKSEFTVKGTGPIAKIVRNMVSKLDKEQLNKKLIDVNKCSPDVSFVLSLFFYHFLNYHPS
jgi:hypothetical protein